MFKKIKSLFTRKKPKRIFVVPRGMNSGKQRRLMEKIVESAGNVRH